METITFRALPLTDATPSQLSAYKKLSIPASHFLLSSQNNRNGIAIEARIENNLVGLILAQIYYPQHTAQLYSIEIEQDLRNRGIGTNLFGYLQNYLIQEKHIRALGFEYEQTSPYSAALEKIIAKHNWLPPKLYLLRLYFNVPEFNPPWFQRHLRPLKECKILKWRDLESEEKKRILYMEEQGRFLAYLSPFNNEESIEPINSLGLRYKGQVMGWCITHRRDPKTIIYSALFIDSDLKMTGLGIQLLCQSIRLQKDSPIPIGVFEINLREIDRTWKHFVNKRLKPFASRIERMKWATHIFSHSR